jgi:prophage regulatory protein
MIRERERCEITGIPLQTWYDMQKVGLAPPPVRLGKYAVAYPESELAALNAARKASKSDAAIKKLVKELVARRKHAFDPFEAAS